MSVLRSRYLCRWAFLHLPCLHISESAFSALCFPFYFCAFPLDSSEAMIVLQNTFSHNTSGTRLIIYVYVSKFVYFSCFGLYLAVINVQ
jgi:hypothetical protein